MSNEAQIMSEAYDILATSEPMTTNQLQRELSMSISRADLDAMLNRTVFAQDGVAKGYTPGTFAKTPDGRWTVKQLGMKKGEYTDPTSSFIAAII